MGNWKLGTGRKTVLAAKVKLCRGANEGTSKLWRKGGLRGTARPCTYRNTLI